MNMSYAEQERILRKNTGMLPRTWDEATRNADYATPLWRTKTGVEQMMDNIAVAVLLGIMFLVGMYLGYAIAIN